MHTYMPGISISLSVSLSETSCASTLKIGKGGGGQLAPVMFLGVNIS